MVVADITPELRTEAVHTLQKILDLLLITGLTDADRDVLVEYHNQLFHNLKPGWEQAAKAVEAVLNFPESET